VWLKGVAIVGRMQTIGHIDDLPFLDDTSVHIWGLEVSSVEDRLDRLHTLLCPNEREKAARFHREADRNSSIAARGALRILLSGYTGMAAENVNFAYSENGKPRMINADIDFNVSHSGAWVVFALGRNRNIGVDIEQIKRKMDVLAVAERFFTDTEVDQVRSSEDPCAAFFQLWARKEAYVKACGSTLFSELAHFSVPLEEQGEKDGWIFQRLEAGSNYAAAIVTDKEMASVPCYDFGGLKWDN